MTRPHTNGSAILTQTLLVALVLTMLVGVSPAWAEEAAASLKAKFNPKDIEGLEMFLESVTGIVVATNTSEDAYNHTGEGTPTDRVWTDHKRFPTGTVRWWFDQSSMGRNPSRRNNKPWPTGRAFGQDDHDRPGYIPDGCNGKPCVRGAISPKEMKGKFSHHYKQPCYFELQPEDRFFFSGPFSVFILVKPPHTETNYVYFGAARHSVLAQQVKDNSLHFWNSEPVAADSQPTTATTTKSAKYKVPPAAERQRIQQERWGASIRARKLRKARKAMGKDTKPRPTVKHTQVRLTGADAVEPGKWQLIEVHRNVDNELQCVVNGKNVTTEAPKIGGDFWFTMFMNNNKGQDSRYYPFTGDLAAFVLYNNDLTDRDKKNVRDYFDGIYDFKNTKVEPKPKAEPAPK